MPLPCINIITHTCRTILGFSSDEIFFLHALTWPLHLRIHDIQVSIADQLHVDGVCSFSIYIFVLVVMKATDTNMGAIDAPDDVGEARHGIEFGFGNLGISSMLKLHISVKRACQHLCYPVYSSAHSGFADAERITDIYLESGRCKTRNATMICITGANPPFRNWANSPTPPQTRLLAIKCHPV